MKDFIMNLPKKNYKLKIAIIGHIDFSIGEPYCGGLEAFTHILAKKLIERGHDVTVFAAEGTDSAINPYIISKSTEKILNDSIFRFIGKKKVKKLEKESYLKIMQILQNSDFDIIHNNSHYYTSNQLSKTLEFPIMTTVHTAFYQPYAFSNKKHKLVAVSKFIQNLYKDRSDTTVIYNGIMLKNFTIIPKKDKKNYLVWFGRITKEKGTEYAIQAAKKLGMTLKIAGNLSRKKYFKRQIQPLLNENIEYVGNLSHKKLNKLISEAQVSLCTSDCEEAYGLVVAEALACGTPVAAFARGAIPELLDEKSGVLAIPNNIDSLAQAVQKAMNLEPKDCRKRAEEIADIDVMVDKYEELYYELAKK